GFPPQRLDRRPRRGLTRRGHHQRGPEGTDRACAAHPDPARGEDREDALWSGGWLGAYAEGGWPVVRRYPRAHSPDRGQGPAQTASSFALPQAQVISQPRARMTLEFLHGPGRVTCAFGSRQPHCNGAAASVGKCRRPAVAFWSSTKPERVETSRYAKSSQRSTLRESSTGTIG